MLKAKARKIPGWQLDKFGLVGKLQQSPALSVEPIEEVTLIPMGAARLRISSFPTVSSNPGAHEWVPPRQPPVSASHVFSGDSVEALIDGVEPRDSNDRNIPRFTWWDRKGSTEWVQHDFSSPRTVSSTMVYWFDDQKTGGGCRTPQSWRLLFRKGNSWLPVSNASPYETSADRFNQVNFTPVTTSALRLEAQLQPGFSAGILEWKNPVR